MISTDLIIQNAHIITVSARGEIANGCIAIKDEIIIDIFEGENKDYHSETVIDANGKLVIPGFVDCHTHLVHAGSRANELQYRLQGMSYQEIQQKGGGIHASVRDTRAAAVEELYQQSLERAKLCIKHGTTTAEIKSGYGLEPATEKKMLEVIHRINDESDLETVATFLGPHVYPQDREPEAYLDWLLHEGLELAKEQAEFVDIYCDVGAYSYADTEKFLKAAKAKGISLKIHSGQFEALGATGLAADLSVVSADHLDHVTEAEFDAMLRAGTVPVFLPGCSYYLKTAYPDARPYLDAGMPVALATDYNPGTCPSLSIPMMMSLAVMHMGFTPDEALTAVTLNAAKALKQDHLIGSLEKGKQADILICEIGELDDIIAMFGVNAVSTVVKKGLLI
ncbi:MAG: imidazolonepropionase [Candidatus Marinimicrobia bacterium]|nr:imidazolonepropionase [Candidatus Neomarinimicrobiota bacterium]